MVYLKVKSKLSKSVYYLNISATDDGVPEKKAYVQLKVMVKEENNSIGTDLIPNQPISAFFPQQYSSQPATSKSQPRSIVYELVENSHNHLLTIDSSTARLQLNQVPDYESTPSNVELQIKAYLADQPQNYVLARLVLNDVTEVKLTHFAQCHYEAHLLENPSAYTRVLQFNFRGDVEGVELLNGTEYFTVNPDGTMSVKPGVKIDREEIRQIVVKARLKSQSSLHPKSLELCQIATANILIDDQNDHTPRFDKTAYTFRIDTLPYNNTEVGSLKAVDKDKGEFGRVHYRILDDEYEPIPFLVFQADGAATIYYVTKRHDYFPEKSYTFTLEAYDADVDPRTSRVSIHVLLEPETTDQETESLVPNKNDRDTSSNGSEEDDSPATQPHVEEHSQEETATQEISTTTSSPSSWPENYDTRSGGEERRGKNEKSTEVVDSKDKKDKRTDHSAEETMQIVQEEVQSLQSPPVLIVHKDSNKPTKKKFTSPETGANTFNPNSKPSKSSSIKFGAESYNFSLKGKLDEGQYIGQVHIDVNHPVVENQQLEYAVEEGIAGFVEIDSYTGSLSVGRELTKDSYEEIRFSAAVQSRGQVLATTLVTVVMDDNASIYDIPPAFEQSLYRFETEENQEKGRIGKVEAHHRAVELGKDRLWYVLDRNSKDYSLFRIETETGWLSNRQPLDAELKRTYNLKLSACLETNTSSCARAQVVIIVTDTNDNAPEFNRSSFDITIPLNLPIGSELVRVSATDADTGKNGEISYSLRTSYAFQSLFEIDPKTGAVTLAKKLSGDTVNSRVEPGTVYRIEVDATDHGQPPMSSSTSVKITTADINPSSPEFDKFRYEVVFNTSVIPQNTLVTQVHATDPDGGMDGKVVYRFSDADDQASNSNNMAEKVVVKNYSIDSQTGKITTIAEIMPQRTTFDADNQDHDNDHHHNSLTHLLVVEAMDQSTTFARRSQTVVIIKINAPEEVKMQVEEKRVEFNPLPKTVFISSAKPLNSTILRVSAKVIDVTDNSADASLQGSIVYSIGTTDDNTQDTFFTILNDQLTVSKGLEPNEYDIQIKAQVKGLSPAYHAIHVVVDAEEAQFPVKMKALNASVSNGRIAYSILSPKNIKGIDVDKITGQLALFEKPSAETFVVVRAVNIDHPSFFSDVGVTLNVDKFKQKPSSALSFDSKLYRLIAKEGQLAGSVINTLAISLLNPDHLPNIQYRFEPESLDFGVLPNGSVVIKRRLESDRIDGLDDKGVVELKIVAQSGDEDVARSRVQIAIEKMRIRKPPVFDQPEYMFYLNSPVQSGNVVGQLKATAEIKGLPISYNVLSGTAQPYFELNPSDGTIVKSSFRQLESGKTYDLQVEAKDTEGGTTTTSVKFVVNYHLASTTTSKPSLKVHELGVKTWNPINEKDNHLTIGEDLPPDAKWEFRIASGNQLGNFHLNQLNDHLAQLELVDGQNVSSSIEEIKVEAVNQDDPMETAHADVMVDLRGMNKPTTSTSTTSIPTTSTTSSISLSLPKPLVKFLDISSNPQGIIAVSQVNLEQAGQWNPPQPIYRVQAVASGGEDQVKYSITQNSLTDQLFRIDQETGNLYLNANIKKRTGKEEEFELLVKAEAAGISAQRFYTIKVVAGSGSETTTAKTSAITTSSPVFPTETITSSTVSTSLSSTTLVEDQSSTETSESTEEQSSQNNEVKEEVSSAPSVTPSSDSIAEVRPQPPKFELPNYHFVVDQPVKGALIGHMKAVKEAGREVQMTIEPALFQNWFSFDPTTSSLYVRDVPNDRYDKQRAEFHVSIQDVDDPNLKSKSYVKVDLILPPSPDATTSTSPQTSAVTEAINNRTNASEEYEEPTSMPFIDQFSNSVISTLLPTLTPSQSDTTTASRFDISTTNIDISSSTITTTPNIQLDAPQTTSSITESSSTLSFPHKLYTAMLPEGRYGSRGALVSLRPQALREGMPQGISYVIDSPDQPQLPFYVHNETGELIAFSEIDRETEAEYHFKVIAIGSTEKAETDVQISILDVNDNYPVFVAPIAYVLPLDRLTPPGQVLTRFTAQDADEGRLGKVIFRLEEDADGLFQISKTGDLVLAKNIPLEKEDVFSIVVAAVDGGRPALKTTHKVRIELFADSLGKPAFKQPNYTVDKTQKCKGDICGQVVAGTSHFSYELMPLNDPSLTSAPTGLLKQYNLNVSATGEDGSKASTMVSVFVEGEKIVESTTKPDLSMQTTPEVAGVRKKDVHLCPNGCRSGMRALYTIHQGTDEFFVDEKTGEFL
uniref:Cadherin domain-containing protein n=1 Tax=Ditylenchus dipsaci TaxID=166011 RepID=A0A915E5X9_9BILA